MTNVYSGVTCTSFDRHPKVLYLVSALLYQLKMDLSSIMSWEVGSTFVMGFSFVVCGLYKFLLCLSQI